MTYFTIRKLICTLNNYCREGRIGEPGFTQFLSYFRRPNSLIYDINPKLITDYVSEQSTKYNV